MGKDHSDWGLHESCNTGGHIYCFSLMSSATAGYARSNGQWLLLSDPWFLSVQTKGHRYFVTGARHITTHRVPSGQHEATASTASILDSHLQPQVFPYHRGKTSSPPGIKASAHPLGGNSKLSPCACLLSLMPYAVYQPNRPVMLLELEDGQVSLLVELV